VNVSVENLTSCKKLIKIELDVQTVDQAVETATKELTRKVVLPGFRAGKAPRDMVEKQFSKEIEAEARRKMVSDGYTKAVQEHKLNVVNQPEIEEIQFSRGQPFVFAATVETSPDFEMPEYRGLPAKRELARVTDEDVEKAIETLRTQKADFKPVDRPLQNDDIAVVNYAGTCEGKPISEVAPAAQGLTQKSNTWIAVKKDSFVPGFTEQLLGASKGEKRTVHVDFAADFVARELAGKHGVYEVEILEVRERVLLPLGDALANEFGAANMELLRRGVRQDLQNELNNRQRRSIRSQVVRVLLNRTNFELPESFVAQETRSIVFDIVHENQKRGVSKETIDRNKDDIYAAANQTAKERVKLGFLVSRIAEQEGIRATEAEVHTRIVALAQSYSMSAQNFLKELRKRNGLPEIYQQIIHDKVLDFLQEHARIEDVEPGAAPPPES
jgi:trigger factor